MTQLGHRPVEENDIPLICHFPQNEEELFFMFPKASFPLTPPQLREAISQRMDSTVAILEGQTVAFANFYQWESGGRCSVGNVIVAPTARRGGIARYLIEQMTALAFSKHRASEVAISCFSGNVAGLLLYPRLGFQPYAIEERRDKRGERAALIHMKLLRHPG